MGKDFILQNSGGSVSKARRLRARLTDAEWKLWARIRGKQLGMHFRRQAPFGPYIADFAAVKQRLVIEVDGSQHYTEEGRKKDARRDRYLRGKGLTVLHFSNLEVLKNIDGVLMKIAEALSQTADPLSSPSKGDK